MIDEANADTVNERDLAAAAAPFIYGAVLRASPSDLLWDSQFHTAKCKITRSSLCSILLTVLFNALNILI